MKTKISISMDEDTISAIEAELQQGVFRNKSHFIEHASKKMLEALHDGTN